MADRPVVTVCRGCCCGTAWVRGGGPGIAEPPPVLDLRVFTPGRRARKLLRAGA